MATKQIATPVKTPKCAAVTPDAIKRAPPRDWIDLLGITIVITNVGRMKEVTLKDGSKASLYEIEGFNAEGIKFKMSLWNSEGLENGSNMFKFIK
jgi:hypothetical protein